MDVLVQPELVGEAGPSHRRGLLAVVLGAGVGGLLAAHVACRHFEEVTVLEKDAVLAGRVEDEGVEQVSASGLHACSKAGWPYGRPDT